MVYMNFDFQTATFIALVTFGAVHVLKPVLYHLKYIDLRFLILDLYLNPSAHDHLPVLPNPPSPLSVYPRSSNDFT